MAVQQYITRPFEPGDEEQVLDLLKISLGDGPGGGRDERFWRWKHLDNPFGPSYIRVALGGEGKLVGMRAFMRWAQKDGWSTYAPYYWTMDRARVFTIGTYGCS